LRKQLELTTLDDLWRRHAYMLVEAQLHALTGDLAALNGTTATIAELAAKFEGWKPYLSYCRAQIHRLLGELGAAESMLLDALATVAPGEHRAYGPLALAHVDSLLLQQRFDEALIAATRLVAHAKELKLDQSVLVSALRLRALVLSAQGEHADAQEALREAFMLARSLEYGGLPLACLYEAQARLAVAENDAAAGIQALAMLRDLLEHADAPLLFGAYEALRIENKRQVHGSLHPASETPESVGSLPAISQIQTASSSDTSDSDQLTPSGQALTSRAALTGKNRPR
jgi:tetratricopeptide (TPR) repeat protein